MKKVLSLFFFINLYGCAYTTFKYDFAFTGANGTPPTTPMYFEDDLIKVTFEPTTKRIKFTLENKTGYAMKINWDDCSIVQFNEAKRVLHFGVKYTERGLLQPPTTIPAKAKIIEMVMPSENIYYREGVYSRYYTAPGGWEESFMWYRYAKTPEIKEAAFKLKGETFFTYIPIQIQGKIQEYYFNFKITDVKKISGYTGNAN